MAVSISVRQAPSASAQTTITSCFPYCYGLFGGAYTWPYNYGLNGWNYWGGYNSWPYYGSYSNYNYSSYLPYNYASYPVSYGYPSYNAVSVTPGLASPAWLYCSVPGRGPIWVDAAHIPPGVMC